MSVTVRRLQDSELDEAWALGLQAFGGDRESSRPSASERQQWGAFDDGRLLAKATLLPYAQWFGGRPVPMAGIAGVAVRPEARGRGLTRALMHALGPSMREQGLSVSTLFGTAPGVYRSLGWEVVGTLDETCLPVADLAGVQPGAGVQLRPADPSDVPALQALWDARARAGNGALTRTGTMFPRGAQAALEADVVTLAESGGAPVGYVSYDRGRGYGPQAELRVWELVAGTVEAHRALLRSLAGWDSVVGTVRWRGPTDELRLLLGRAVPAPDQARPWSLRLVDPSAALVARGWGADADVSFALVDPGAAEPETAWRLQISSGEAVLEPAAAAGLPRLHVRGLAVLYAGGGSAALLQRAGLLDAALPALDAAFAGPDPVLLDYF